MKLLLLLLICCNAAAQSGDFFVLKKSGKTIQSFYSGTYISLITKNDEPYAGYIKKVAKDSVWIEYREILRGFTAIGSVLQDTITYEAKKFAVKDIRNLAKEKGGFAEVSLSGLMKIGAAGYSFLHVVNSIILHQKISARNISIAAGIYIAGVIIKHLHKDYYTIGKRYQLNYISLSSK